MSDDPDPENIIQKLEGLFGDVLSGESLIQKFYAESQKPDETVSSWGCRLEQLLTSAVEKGKILDSAKNDMLRSQFWGNLYSEQLKNACRHKYDIIDNFAELCIAVRAIEQELTLDAQRRKKSHPSKVQSHMMTETTEASKSSGKSSENQLILEKLELLTKKVEQLEKQKSFKPKSQGRKPTKMIICYKCGNEGHFANKCESDTRISEEQVKDIKRKQKNSLNSEQPLPRSEQRT